MAAELGLVFGALPLVIHDPIVEIEAEDTGLEHYNEGLKPLKDFVQYESLIQELADNLEIQRTRLRSNCETLLIDLALSDEDLIRLLDDPTSSSWKEDNLVHQLKNRLQSSYGTFSSIVNKLAELLKDLTTNIGLDSQGQPKWADQETHKHCWKRFKRCLQRKKLETLIDQMAKENGHLQHLIADGIYLEPLRLRRRKKKGSFKQVRDHAARLHDALQSRWSCNCSIPHHAELRLEQRDWDQPPCFRVTFPLHSTVSHISPSTWHETDIKATQKPTQKPTCAAITHSHTTTGVATHFSTRLRQLKTEKKGVAFAIAPAMPAAEISMSKKEMIQENMTTEPEARDINDLCAALRSTDERGTNDCLGTLKGEGSLYEVVSISNCDKVDTSTLTFHDLLILSNQNNATNGGLTPIIDPSLPRCEPRLTRKDRLQLAVTLAFTSLQLFTTPWLDKNWSGQEILFRRGSVDSPFISRAFAQPDQIPMPQTSSTSDFSPIRNQSIFRLGVLLLEISLGKPLDAYMTSDQPLLFKDYLVAAQLVSNLVNEESDNYVSATKACIFSDFGSKVKEPDFNNDAFRQAVYEDVIQPLERDLEFFYRRP
ncbi:MAG: hypothetical protein Q9216_006047 [Gyalolechia sp. 2 TL-2023]